ncbi:RNA polymerase ECF-type sigma factor [Pedobacter sp. BAL39]|uniref:RNA polymerase sigma factor n=1 Tax=Pedobacter sp. BAL39 TaxID=391596 RepID=UPI000155AE77|nr:sigma-70 family RNA polymerase sigma factor [Pedobacter sp. BAL39]EDM34112.1 RNA polymerase ECF-type sigma factor [Pedobacter sp. BAL39]
MINEKFGDERRWLSLLKEGDRTAFDTIYHFYSNPIYSRILAMTKVSAVADELLQDIFLKVWENREQINEDLSFQAWLYRIAENSVYDYYRRLARDAKMREHTLRTFAELYNHTEDYILNKERSQLLEKALSRLPPQRQLIFKLCRLEGKSYEEAATLLNISTSTVSNQLVKATKNIKDYVFFHSKEFLVFIIALYLKR